MAEEYLYGKYDRARCHGRRGAAISRRTRILSCRRPFKRPRGCIGRDAGWAFGHCDRRPPLWLRGRRARCTRGCTAAPCTTVHASGRRPAPLAAAAARHEYHLCDLCVQESPSRDRTRAKYGTRSIRTTTRTTRLSTLAPIRSSLLKW